MLTLKKAYILSVKYLKSSGLPNVHPSILLYFSSLVAAGLAN